MADERRFITDAVGEFLCKVAAKKFNWPLRFLLTDAHGSMQSQFTIHKDGIERQPPTGPRSNTYHYSLTMTVRSADGWVARTGTTMEPVEFLMEKRAAR